MPCIRLSFIRIATVLLIVGAGDLEARQTSDGIDDPDAPVLDIQRASGAVDVDGRLDEQAWTNAARSSDFVEIGPGRLIPPLVRTEVLVTYDEERLYVGFRASDDPAAIRATMRGRDETYQDDWVGVILDTFGNAGRGYEMFVNPYGIQMDGLMTSDGSEDNGFDILFISDGRITDEGYVVEMAIPFGSLRFPEADVHSWNVTFIRKHPRETRRTYSWAPIDINGPCFLCEMGSIDGIRDIRSSENLQILPAFVAAQSAVDSRPTDPDTELVPSRIRLEPSLNLRYDVTSSISLEGTVNPDFSQIESDAARIDVNSTFALFFPERRPFFQEGSDLWRTPLDLIYTRTINNPAAAAKTTARLGETRIAVLSAIDQNSPLYLPFEERSALVEAGRSVSNLVRTRRALGANSFIGGVVTDRRFVTGGGGATIGADTRLRFHDKYTFQGQFAVSQTREPDDRSLHDDNMRFGDAEHTSRTDGEHFTGRAMYGQLARIARHWTFELEYFGLSPTFRAGNGFVTRNDFHSMEMDQGIHVYPERGIVDRVSVTTSMRRITDFDFNRRQDDADLWLRTWFEGQTRVNLGYEWRRENFQGIEFDHIPIVRLFVQSNFSDPIRGGFLLSRGREIARNVSPPRIGRLRNASVFLTAKPIDRLVIQPSLNYTRLVDPVTDESFFSGYILRTETNLQFTRELSLRLIAQYNEFSDALAVEPLLKYQLSPFTTVFAGSSHTLSRPEATSVFTTFERQLFFKLQVLFRR